MADNLLKNHNMLKEKHKKKKKKKVYGSEKEEIHRLKSENKRLKKKTDVLVKENNALKSTVFLEEFDQSVKMYMPLMETMFKSSVFKCLMSEFGIDCDKGFKNITNLVRFVGMIGNGTSFSVIMCTFFQNKKIKIGEEETLVFSELNRFYQKVYKMNYDVIFCPDIGGQDRAFNKRIMKDDNNRSMLYKYYDEVYAPGMMRNKTSIERLAIVRGYNE